MIAFCSDNGPEGDATAPGSAGPFRGRKRDLFEGGIRVPGLMEWPAVIEPGSVSDFPAVTSDYLPTILEAVGQSLPDRRPLDGLSLLPVFSGALTERPAPIGFRFGHKVALVGNRYKLVRYGQPARRSRRSRGQQPARSVPGSYQLFDLIQDPGETRDLAMEHPDIVTRMRKTLEAWLSSCAASDRRADYPPTQVVD
jgi:arylsulfatase A-like enzyme